MNETTRVRRLVEIVEQGGKMSFELDGQQLPPLAVARIGAMMVSWAQPRIATDNPDAGPNSPAGPR